MNGIRQNIRPSGNSTDAGFNSWVLLIDGLLLAVF